VTRTPDGDMQHTRCGTVLTFRGARQAMEVDFYCGACLEHVTLTLSALARVAEALPAPAVLTFALEQELGAGVAA
jgi:hypothetical protein